jgi:hypothetical protein
VRILPSSPRAHLLIQAALACVACTQPNPEFLDPDAAGPSDAAGGSLDRPPAARDAADGPPPADAPIGADVVADRALDLAPADLSGTGEPGLVSRWSLNEGQGTSLQDDAGSGNTGTVMGAGWLTPGAPPATTRAACLSFDGTTGAEVTTSGLPALDRPMTLSFWMRPDSLISGRRTALALIRGSNPVVGLQFGQEGSRAAFWLYGATTSPIAGATLTANAWFHIAYTFDGSTHRLYVDGAAVGTSTIASPTGAPTALRLAFYGANISQRFLGELDELRIYDRPLTLAEIKVLASRN